MLASELSDTLQQIIKRHGDLPLLFHDHGDACFLHEIFLCRFAPQPAVGDNAAYGMRECHKYRLDESPIDYLPGIAVE